MSDSRYRFQTKRSLLPKQCRSVVLINRHSDLGAVTPQRIPHNHGEEKYEMSNVTHVIGGVILYQGISVQEEEEEKSHGMLTPLDSGLFSDVEVVDSWRLFSFIR
mmetsp:Transcript_24665/g.29786  ORF Transcript_24665/g.29786 Transcript_24665/m.29786 type:complete len:105 (-) Transcript_24665:269-583(-)